MIEWNLKYCKTRKKTKILLYHGTDCYIFDAK